MSSSKYISDIRRPNWEIKKESSTKICGIPFISRGYYIVDADWRATYLHKDGVARHGVVLNGVGQFWDTKESATTALNQWRANWLPAKKEVSAQ